MVGRSGLIDNLLPCFSFPFAPNFLFTATIASIPMLLPQPVDSLPDDSVFASFIPLLG